MKICSKLYKILFTTLIATLLTSCTISGKKTKLNNKNSSQEQNIILEKNDLSNWWRELDDVYLNKDIEKLLSENLSLKSARERSLQASYRALAASGALLPNISLNTSKRNDYKVTQNSTVNSPTYQFGFSASWLVDLFGKQFAAQKAAKSYAKSVSFEQQALTHSLIAQFVSNRIEIATRAEMLQLANNVYNNRLMNYRLLKRRYGRGSATSTISELYMAEEGYKNAKAELYKYRRMLEASLAKYDVLLGRKPGITKYSKVTFAMPKLPRNLPAALPVELLDRRPDIKVQEMRLRAAKSEVNAAMMGMAPDFSISGNFNFINAITKNLLSPENFVGSIVNAISTKLFDGGATARNIKINKSKAREMANVYANSILTAMEEVKTYLNDNEQMLSELSFQENSLRAIQKTEKLTQVKFSRGVGNYRDLLEVQNRVFMSELNLILYKQQLWQKRISLYLALGGSWVDKK